MATSRCEAERSEASKSERGANARSEHSEDLEKRTANDVSREQRPVSRWRVAARIHARDE
ncbi:hypothetical protein [Natrinema soli]|uniref:Uncharacterized protein n=1 Tax=Natrinema soli TaxID=1930624 RepID=A0ABD5STZ2_9EURY|nr:hypothetical protein [Natrinema soli]